MKIELKSKRAQAILLVVVIAFAFLTAFGLVDFIQTQRTRAVFSAIGAANEERNKKGENMEAAEAFVTALRSINVDYTKGELRPAFSAYVSGFEEGLALAKAGKSTASCDAKIQDAHEKLVQIAKRYE